MSVLMMPSRKDVVRDVEERLLQQVAIGDDDEDAVKSHARLPHQAPSREGGPHRICHRSPRAAHSTRSTSEALVGSNEPLFSRHLVTASRQVPGTAPQRT